jgi:Transcriptional regulator EthR, C-terminal domain
MEQAWAEFLLSFDNAVSAKIEREQELGHIKTMPPRPTAMALNRMDAQVLNEYFGTQPRGDKDEITKTIIRIWCAKLYGVADG